MAPTNQRPLSDEDDPRPATAFRITINGKPFCDTDDLTTVTMVVDEIRGHAEHRVTLYVSGNEGPLRWMTAGLGAGDRIAIEIVDVVAEEQSEEVLACNFCGRDVHAVHALVQGTNGNTGMARTQRLSGIRENVGRHQEAADVGGVEPEVLSEAPGGVCRQGSRP